MKKKVLSFLISVSVILTNTQISVLATDIESEAIAMEGTESVEVESTESIVVETVSEKTETGSEVVEPVFEGEDEASDPMLMSLSDVVYTDDAATGVGNGTADNPYQDFEMALANVVDGGTIIIGANGAYVGTDGTNDSMPLVIDKKVTIKSETGADLYVRRAGIILGADVTFENMAFALANREKNAVFANGHTLTLTNVTQASGTREVHLFAGGVAGSAATMGSYGKIIINGSAAQFGNIYAGSMNMGSDLPATITINGTTSMRIGDIYACGAQTGVYDADDLFGGTEPEAPVASAVNYPVNGKVTIELNNSNVTHISGLASDTNKADVTFSANYPNYNLQLSDIGTLNVQGGMLIPKALNADVNVRINSGAYLDLSAVMVDNAFSVADFVGGGTLQLGRENTLAIKGNVTGVTAFEVADDNVLSGSGIAIENHGYIDVSGAIGDGSFSFVPYATQDGMTLEKRQGVWTTVFATSRDVVSVEMNGTVTNYEDIQTAWNTVCESTVATDAVLTLLDHVDVPEGMQLVLTNDKVNLTIELDGYMLAGSGEGSNGKNGLIYISAGTLTVQDSYDGSYGIYDEYAADGCAIYVDGGKLVMRSGSVYGEPCGIRVAGGTVSLSGGVISALEIEESADMTVGDLLAVGYGYKTYTGWITDTSVKSIAEQVEIQEKEQEQEKPATVVSMTVSPDAMRTSYVVTLSNFEDTDAKAINVAVWSEKGGQNDLIWYTAVKNSTGEYSVEVPIKNHKTLGLYYVHAYAVNGNNDRSYIKGTTFTHEESVSIENIEVKNMDSDAGIFDIYIEGVAATCGVDSVRVPVWSQEKQSDIKWYEAEKQSDGCYVVQVDLANHDFNFGEYKIHAYITSNTQIEKFAGATSATVSKPKTQVLATLTDDEKNCSLIANNVRITGGVQKAFFAVWSEKGGQDDIVWYQASEIDSGTWQKSISIATHKTPGLYNVHLYGEDKNGERVYLGNTTFTVSGVQALSTEIKYMNVANGTFDVYIYGIETPSGVEKVQVPVWSENDQRDIRWYNATKRSNGAYAVRINIGNHNYNYTKYNVHTYVTTGNEIVQFIGATQVSIKPKLASVQALLDSSEKLCNLYAMGVELAGGVQKSYFAVWSEKGGQDDLVWYEAQNTASSTWESDMLIATHKTEGTYQMHLYGEDVTGKRVFLGVTTFHVSEIKAQSISVMNVKQEEGTFDVVISGITSASGVRQVQVPVWSKEDQSDIYWYTASRQLDGSYVAHVDIRNHDDNKGVYVIHTYVTAGNGVQKFTGATTVEIM